jgi:hypothetical protein
MLLKIEIYNVKKRQLNQKVEKVSLIQKNIFLIYNNMNNKLDQLRKEIEEFQLKEVQIDNPMLWHLYCYYKNKNKNYRVNLNPHLNNIVANSLNL